MRELKRDGAIWRPLLELSSTRAWRATKIEPCHCSCGSEKVRARVLPATEPATRPPARSVLGGQVHAPVGDDLVGIDWMPRVQQDGDDTGDITSPWRFRPPCMKTPQIEHGSGAEALPELPVSMCLNAPKERAAALGGGP